jgi:plasmid maintenance system antidote protein VapI
MELKPIKDHDGYFCGEDGVIYSDRVKGHRKAGTLHALKPRHNNRGYALIKARNNTTGKRDDLLVHRLIAEAFIPNPDNLPEVNHKHGDKDDNRPSELEWCTALDNSRHAHRIGLIDNRGERNGNAKLTLEQVKEIRDSYTPWDRNFSGRALARKYGVDDSTINEIIRGRRWKNPEYDPEVEHKPSRRKLSVDEAREINRTYIPNDPKYNGTMLAKKYGVTPKTISDIIHGRYRGLDEK